MSILYIYTWGRRSPGCPWCLPVMRGTAASTLARQNTHFLLRLSFFLPLPLPTEEDERFLFPSTFQGCLCNPLVGHTLTHWAEHNIPFQPSLPPNAIIIVSLPAQNSFFSAAPASATTCTSRHHWQLSSSSLPTCLLSISPQSARGAIQEVAVRDTLQDTRAETLCYDIDQSQSRC